MKDQGINYLKEVEILFPLEGLIKDFFPLLPA